MRGRRAPDISSGLLVRELDEFSASSAADILSTLDRGLPAADRHMLLKEFDLGRNHFVAYVSVKLAPWQHWPLKAFRLAHKDEQVAKQTCQEALQAPLGSLGPQVALLQDSLRLQCEQWISGVPLDSCGLQGLRNYVTLLRLTPTSERRIEGQHARVHQRGRCSPNHTEYYQSFGLRSPELEALQPTQD